MPGMFHAIVQQYAKTLKNLDAILHKAAHYAEARKFDPNNLCTLRLAPDMFTLTKQVQTACDVAKASAAGLAGKEPPKYEDSEKTLQDLRSRIGKVVAYLDTLKAEDFASTKADTKIRIPFPPNKGMLAQEAALQRSMPNFYFHVSAAYIILRHSGVDIGKGDYLGHLNLLDA